MEKIGKTLCTACRYWSPGRPVDVLIQNCHNVSQRSYVISSSMSRSVVPGMSLAEPSKNVLKTLWTCLMDVLKFQSPFLSKLI